MFTNDMGELVIRASRVIGTAQFQGEYSMPMADIDELNLSSNELTDDILKQVVEVLVSNQHDFIRLYRVDLRWNRLTPRCKEHIVRLLSAIDNTILVDVRNNVMSFREMDTAFRDMPESAEYKDEITCDMQELRLLSKRNEKDISALIRSTKLLDQAAKNRSDDMERSMEYVLLDRLSKDGYECTSWTTALAGGKVMALNGNALVQWDVVFSGSRPQDDLRKFFFVEVKEIPHANDIENGDANKKRPNFKTKAERTVEYMRVTLPQDQQRKGIRAKYREQLSILGQYTDCTLVFV
eukprot:gene32261-39018_t